VSTSLKRGDPISVDNDNPTLTGLLRQAAEIGPGYHGRKRSAGNSERQALALEFRNHGEDPPPYLEMEPRWIERRAKLFEAGDYPDKGVTVSPRDLESMAANFDLPVPIWIEHAESPLELGYLTEISAEDGELFGMISLTEEANALIERSGAKSLSVGLSPDLTRIREVSLVRHPRVASARIFHDALLFQADLETSIDWRARYHQAMWEQRAKEAEAMVRSWIAKGQLTPAQAPFASALVCQDSDVRFGDGFLPIRDLVAKLIGNQPKHAMLGEQASQPQEDVSSLLLLPEEAAFYRKHFPDISLEEIAQKRANR
jgi:hypothetical protein